MRHPDLDRMVQHERWLDDLERAAYARLIVEAEQGRVILENRRPTPAFSLRPLVLVLARLLSFIGEHMVTWSCRLQYRYASLSAVSSENQPCR